MTRETLIQNQILHTTTLSSILELKKSHI